MTRQPEFVWMTDEQVYAEVVSLGAHVSVVKFTQAGVEYQVVVNNDEFEYFGEQDDDED